jgi:hypothetical protein
MAAGRGPEAAPHPPLPAASRLAAAVWKQPSFSLPCLPHSAPRQVLARVGRGAMVALPALGAFFIAHLAAQDWRRMAEERGAGRPWAARSFLLAFVGDAVDVALHAVVVAGLLHQHFQASARPCARRRPPQLGAGPRVVGVPGAAAARGWGRRAAQPEGDARPPRGSPGACAVRSCGLEPQATGLGGRRRLTSFPHPRPATTRSASPSRTPSCTPSRRRA